MELLPYLRKLYAYDQWANREVARALQAASEPPPRSVRLMAHVVGTEWTWHSRILPQSKKMAVWPQLTAEQILAEVDELRRAWEGYLGELTPARLEQTATTLGSAKPNDIYGYGLVNAGLATSSLPIATG